MTTLVTHALKYYGRNPKDWKYPWCAAFLNLLLDELGVQHETSLMARSFLKIGEHTDVPKLGDIVVLWRGGKDSQWGHCGLYITESKNDIAVLGGNQDETTNIKWYPKYRLLDIRRIFDERCA